MKTTNFSFRLSFSCSFVFKTVKAVLFLFLFFFLSDYANAGTYYSNNAAPNSTANWWTNTNGTGSNPSNFSASGDIFILQSGQTCRTTADWTIGAGVTLQIDGTLAINGNNDDVIINGTVVFSNSSATQVTMAGAGSGNSFTVASGATLKTNNVNGISGTNCSIIAQAAKKTVSLSTGGNYEFNGSANQLTLGLPATINTITINNSGSAGNNTVTLTQTITVSIQLSISAGTLNISSYSVNSNGSWINNGSFNCNTGSVTFNGAAAQSIGGSQATTFQNVTFNNSNGFTLSKPITINNNAVFTNGIVTTNATNLITFNAGATAGASSNSSFINGPVRKIFNNGESFTFPVGVSGTGDEPVTISGITATGYDFTASYSRTSASSLGGVSLPIYSVSDCDYWTLTKNAGPAAGVSVTLSWDANSPCNGNPFFTNPSALTVAHFTGPNWDQAGISGSYTGNATSGTVTRNGVTNFSPFALGSISGTLPVKFGNVNGYSKNGGVQIDWNTYSESNVSHYEIERSIDGKQFISIGQTAARNIIGNSEYSWFDATPLQGNSFYRIKSIDLDGKSSYSIVIRISLSSTGSGVTLYPNPVHGNDLFFDAASLPGGDYSLRILNSAGQQIDSRTFIHNGGAISKNISLPACIKRGIYCLQLINNDKLRASLKTRFFVTNSLTDNF